MAKRNCLQNSKVIGSNPIPTSINIFMYQVKAEIITGQYAFNNIEEVYAHFSGYNLREQISRALNESLCAHLELRLLTANWISVNITFHEELDFYKLMASMQFRDIKQFMDSSNWNTIITSRSQV